MRIEFKISEDTFRADTSEGISIAIPLDFSGPQPNSFGVPPARGEVYRAGSFIGDTRQGGSCNCETYTVTPHCNGTHTECAGHITLDRESISRHAPLGILPAYLHSVRLQSAGETRESYTPPLESGDMVVSLASLEPLSQLDRGWLEALAIRTVPNTPAKKSRNYAEEPAPFLTNEAMQFIFDLGVKHLLIDLPSVDRANDQGMLSNHRIFWGVAAGQKEVRDEIALKKTITELIYVPDTLRDGPYLLDLQIAPFESDAAPSRPIFYSVESP
ncbi:MAG: hypothetical protein DCC75_04010 [Proteobacteria bacterium]|nr:MAG: hypothetical protein DCC75_04010 [Pseudomonadota bacterium]